MSRYDLRISRGKARFRDEFGCPIDEFKLSDEKKASSSFMRLIKKLR